MLIDHALGILTGDDDGEELAVLIQPFQLLALTAPGATLFTHYVGEKIDSLAGISC